MKKIFTLFFLILFMVSCTNELSSPISVLQNVERGATLKTISQDGNLTDGYTLVVEARGKSPVSIIEVYLNDDPIRILYLEDSTGTGLGGPQFSINIIEANPFLTHTEGAVLDLVLTTSDGKVYDVSTVTSSLTGSYFASPFTYNVPLNED